MKKPSQLSFTVEAMLSYLEGLEVAHDNGFVYYHHHQKQHKITYCFKHRHHVLASDQCLSSIKIIEHGKDTIKDWETALVVIQGRQVQIAYAKGMPVGKAMKQAGFTWFDSGGYWIAHLIEVEDSLSNFNPDFTY